MRPPTSLVSKSAMLLLGTTWPDANFAKWSGFEFKAAQPGLEDKAVWVGSNLALRIDGGRVLYLFNAPIGNYEGGPSVHRFAAWLTGPRFYVVTVTCNECHITYLIDARDGTVRDIGAPPLVSPNGQLGLVYWPDMESGDVGPYILDFRSYPPARIDIPGLPNCESRPQAGMLRTTAVWIDDTRVKFEGRGRTPDTDDATQLLQIANGQGTWQCR
jgi:hypothetical protein